MKVLNILFSQVVRLTRASAEPGTPILRGGNFIRALADRYAFIEMPRSAEDLDLNKGITFKKGVFKNQNPIEKLQVYNDGLLVESFTVPTDVLDEFVDDCLLWLQEYGGVSRSQTGQRAYVSNLEVVPGFDLESKISMFTAVGNKLFEFTKGYGLKTETFRMYGIQMFGDFAAIDGPCPQSFSFERRAGQGWETGVHFSSAPLTTEHHLALLDEIESIFQ